MDVKRVTVPVLLSPRAHRAFTRLPNRFVQVAPASPIQTNTPVPGVTNNQILAIGISG